MRAGDLMLKRSIYRGNVRWTRAWTEAEAAEIRAEGERVIAAAPWPAGWGPLGPPRDWHVV